MCVTSFHERLKELAEEKTPKTLHKEIGVELSLVYRFLKGTAKPSALTAIKMAEYFGCTLSYLMGLSEDFTPDQVISPKEFKDIFAEILVKNHCTRYKLDKEKKFSRNTVDDWFHGVRLPSIDSLIILAEYFDCSIDYLLGREN